MADSPHIINVTAATFAATVIEGSRQRPVLVDFWANWCAPCRQLMPILAKLVQEYNGQLLLAKVDTDAEQALATRHGIRSLPTVQLFKAGRAVDQFMGALPESQIRAFLEPHVEDEAARVSTGIGALIDAGDLDGADARLREAQAADPANDRYFVLEVRLRIARGDFTGAAALLERSPLSLVDDPELAAARNQLLFAAIVATAPPAAALEARLRTDPNDSEARYQLAARQVLAGDFEAALEHLLTLMRHDRAFGEDAARKAILMIFERLGSSSELVTRYRARLSRLLY